MCVIAVKPRRKEMFSDELIREMFRANPDGAGLMYPDDKGVRIKKGFMHVDQVLNFVHSRNWEDVPVVMHFRIGTAGPNDKYNCHPYAVGKKNIINGHCELGMAHNGILHKYNPTSRNSKINDTQIFLHTFIDNLAPGFLKKPQMRRLIKQESLGNRLCFMDAEGKIYKFGDWSTYQGYSFSNLRFLPYQYQYSYLTNKSWLSPSYGMTSNNLPKYESKSLFDYDYDPCCSNSTDFESFEDDLDNVEIGNGLSFDKLFESNAYGYDVIECSSLTEFEAYQEEAEEAPGSQCVDDGLYQIGDFLYSFDTFSATVERSPVFEEPEVDDNELNL